MTNTGAIKLLEIERECISRNNEKMILCDRNCEKCDLVQDSDKLVEMYNYAIESLKRDEIGLNETIKQIHDGVYAEAERKTIEKCVDMFSDIASDIINRSDECILLSYCDSSKSCKENWKEYLLEMLKEKEQ